jgi:epoxyqueuosine reductase
MDRKKWKFNYAACRIVLFFRRDNFGFELDYDQPATDHCGSCTRCIDACPTQAIIQPYVVDGSKCISYLTIELKSEFIPTQFSNKMEGWVFGCDICQDVCPWNRFASPSLEPDFQPLRGLQDINLPELLEDQFNQIFANSPIKRTKFRGLKRNVLFVEMAKK